ncbi:radical SAM protein [Meiothermus sp.]|uniref:radical SAM protein n=1 Tax=Meiothermus sp. TaxID=1955249 RepID=UPI0026119F66|nr:radical SAM protein [Meiothermus sp.]
MNTARLQQPGPSCLTVLPTFRCTAACANCCFGSHPWVPGRTPQEDILRYIREAARFESLSLVTFSGGECFLLGDDLVEAVALATRLGLATRCVTNGYWASSEKAALHRLVELRDAGLTELNLSTGDNHAKFVPIENILHGAKAAAQLGIGVAIMVELQAERRVTKQVLLEHPLAQGLFDGHDLDANVTIVESPWIAMEDGEVPYDTNCLINADNVHLRSGCTSILSTIVPTPQKELFACCGITAEKIPEVKLGLLDQANMHDMYEAASNDFIKIWLAVDGPEKIVAWAGQKDPSIEWENRFAHQCDICRFMYQSPQIKRVIREHYQEVVGDVLLRFSLLRS